MMNATEMADILRPVLFGIPAGMLAVMGLLFWLVGLRMLLTLLVFLAALAGGLAATIWGKGHLWVILCFMIIPGAATAFLEKPAGLLFSCLLAALVVLLIPAVSAQVRHEVLQQAGERPVLTTDPMTIHEQASQQLAWFKKVVSIYWQRLPSSLLIASAGTALAVFLVGLAAWRLVCAVSCSLLGAVCMAAGLAVLLWLKGQQAIDFVVSQAALFWGIFAAAVALGTVFNLILCPEKFKKKKPAGPSTTSTQSQGG